MKVLIVGGGGREHAISWKLSQSPLLKKLYIAPGNGGTQKVGENVSISADDIEGLLDFVKREKIDLTVVGPEAPLVKGIVDLFNRKEFRIVGPDYKAAQLEGSKSFTKKLLKENNIPTAFYEEFENYDRAVDYIKSRGAPIVVKADGLAAGKGVTVAFSVDEALNALKKIMVDKAFGDAGKKVVIEEYLEGEEASYIVFTDGKNIVPLASSQDHKRAYDDDKGPNTGGMGAYSPAPVVTPEIEKRIMEEIIFPTIKAMEKRGTPFRGILYGGLMITREGPKVLEFNVRFGDPETQPLLLRMKGDLLDTFVKLVEGRLDEAEVNWSDDAAVCVVMASGGYPGKYEKGKLITGLEEAEKIENVVVFHAGTRYENGKYYTNGGRVLGVTALGRDIPSAIKRAYSAAERITWESTFYRKDIGKKALKRLG